jgi:hypothetical protein
MERGGARRDAACTAAAGAAGALRALRRPVLERVRRRGAGVSRLGGRRGTGERTGSASGREERELEEGERRGGEGGAERGRSGDGGRLRGGRREWLRVRRGFGTAGARWMRKLEALEAMEDAAEARREVALGHGGDGGLAVAGSDGGMAAGEEPHSAERSGERVGVT